MTVLGALVAGGDSARFGSDKALALWRGRSLIDHAVDALRGCCDDVVICGREWNGLASVADRPAAGLGPLGGLNAALGRAQDAGHALVLCAPVDVVPLAANLAHLLDHAGPAIVAGQRMVGLWPSSLASALDDYLASGQRSVRGWVAASGAVAVHQLGPMYNINLPEDLAKAVP